MNCLLLFRICDLDEQPTCTATQHQYQYKQQLAPTWEMAMVTRLSRTTTATARGPPARHRQGPRLDLDT